MKIKTILLILLAVFLIQFCDEFSDPGLKDSVIESMEEKINIYNTFTEDSVEVADTLDALFVKSINDSTYKFLHNDTNMAYDVETNEIDDELASYIKENNSFLTVRSLSSIPYVIDFNNVTGGDSTRLKKYSHFVFKLQFSQPGDVDILLDDFYRISVIEVVNDKSQYIELDKKWDIEEFIVNTYNHYLDYTSLDVNEKKANLILKERAIFTPKPEADYYVVIHNEQKNIYFDRLKLVVSNY